MRYRKKPVVIEAMKYDGANGVEIAAWSGGVVKFYNVGFSLSVETLEGNMSAKPGDYIIKGVKGEFYPCKPDIFETTYELVEE